MPIEITDSAGKKVRVAGIGVPGKSAYEYAVDGGYTGTEQEFSNLLGKVSSYSNPNLLDNWYFGTGVINQRGTTGEADNASAGSFHYTIDRWWMYAPGTWGLVPDGIELSNVGGYRLKYWSLAQPITRFGDETNYPLSVDWTVSILVGDHVYSATFTPGVIVQELEFNDLNTGLPAGNSLMLNYRWNGTTTIYPTLEFLFYEGFPLPCIIKAAKLEMGTKQTLAHQDASGSWVLNDPPPDKMLELTKCQQYQMQIVRPQNANSYGCVGMGLGVTSTRATIMCPLPNPFFSNNGTIVWSGEWRLYYAADTYWANGIEVTNITFECCDTNTLMLKVFTAGNLTPGTTYQLVYVVTDEKSNSLLLDMNL